MVEENLLIESPNASVFVNSLETGKVIGIFYRFIETCIANKIDFRQYLTYMLNCAPALRRNEIEPMSFLAQFINQNLRQSGDQ